METVTVILIVMADYYAFNLRHMLPQNVVQVITDHGRQMMIVVMTGLIQTHAL
jgi:hypothetical protein